MTSNKRDEMPIVYFMMRQKMCYGMAYIEIGVEYSQEPGEKKNLTCLVATMMNMARVLSPTFI